MNQKKKLILIALMVILAIAAATWFVLNMQPSTTINQPAANLPPAPKYTKTDLPTDKLPEVFPKDLIQETSPIILENYEADVEGGIKQYTIKYVSNLDQITIIQTYLKYLLKNGWSISQQGISKSYEMASMTVFKGKDRMIILAVYNQTAGFVVDITLLKSL